MRELKSHFPCATYQSLTQWEDFFYQKIVKKDTNNTWKVNQHPVIWKYAYKNAPKKLFFFY